MTHEEIAYAPLVSTDGEPGESPTEEASAQGKTQAVRLPRQFPLFLSPACVRGGHVGQVCRMRTEPSLPHKKIT